MIQNIIMISVDEALDKILNCSKDFGFEIISINNALGRILAEDIFADRDYPPFNRATMDGYAVQSNDFIEHKKSELQLIETVFAGDISKQQITTGNCIKIMTGAAVPIGADAVIRIEDTEIQNLKIKFNNDKISINQNIAQKGEDAKEGHLILEKNKTLDAISIAVLAVVGCATLKVYCTPKVAIISTGNEIVSVETPINTVQIRDSNFYTLNSFLKKYNLYNVKNEIIKDEKEILKQTLAKYFDNDILIISGGVSKGDADYIPEVLKNLGVVEVFHRVAIKPGNPLWFGVMPNGGVVFGLPGNPVSVQVAYKVFIEPFIRKCFNLEKILPLYFPLLKEKNKKTKFREYFPCKLISENKKTGLMVKKMNTSGDIVATLNTDGIAIHLEDLEIIKEDTIVEFYFW